MRSCSKCGKELQENVKFCAGCGAQVEAAAADEAIAADEIAVAEEAETAEAVVADFEQKKPGKSKKNGIIAGVVALVAVAGVSAVAIANSNIFEDPKEVVIDAFKSVYNEDVVTPAEQIFGFADMSKSAKTQSSEMELSLVYDGSSSPYMDTYIGSGFDMLTQNDVVNNKNSMTVGVQYQGMDLLHADVYMDESDFMLAIPDLSETVFTLNYADNIQEQIENSPFLGSTILESGFELSGMEDYIAYSERFQDEENAPFNLKDLWDRYKTGSQAIDELKAEMTVEKGEKALQIVDGKEVKCRAYEAVIPGEAFVEFFRSTSDFFLDDQTIKKDVLEYMSHSLRFSPGTYLDAANSPEALVNEAWTRAEITSEAFLDELEKMLSDDIYMTVYVDRTGRLVALDAATKLTYLDEDEEDEEDVDLELSVALKGGDYLTQNAVIELTMFDDEVEATFEIVKKESYDESVFTSSYDVQLVMDGDVYQANYTGTYQVGDGTYEMELDAKADMDQFKLSVEGVVTDLEKGKRIEISADSIRLQIDQDYVELSGSYKFQPLEGEVTALEGKSLDILAATESDWETALMEMQLKIMAIVSKLQ